MRTTVPIAMRGISLLLAGHVVAAQQSIGGPPDEFCRTATTFGQQPTLVVDLRLHSGEQNRRPSYNDSAAVLAVGGTILHAFNVAVLRVRLDTNALRPLLRAHTGIAEVAYRVSDAGRFDVRLQVFFDHAVVDADTTALSKLGATISDRLPLGRVVHAIAADSLVPRLAVLRGVAVLRAEDVRCGFQLSRTGGHPAAPPNRRHGGVWAPDDRRSNSDQEVRR